MENYKETIICPNCGTIQEATIDLDVPFPVFIHDCVSCKYKIMESEWEVVKPCVSEEIEGVSEEFAKELLRGMTAMNEATAAMSKEFNKAMNACILHGYVLKNAMRVALIGSSLISGAKLDTCWKMFRWYWRRKMNKANQEIARLDSDINVLQTEFPDICKPL